MKSYEQIIKEIDNNHELIKTSREHIIELEEKREKEYESLGKTQRERLKADKSNTNIPYYNSEIERIKEHVEMLRLAIRIMQSNAAVALFTETIPTIVSVLNKYKDKKIGAKRTEQIRTEIKEKAGVYLYRDGTYTNVTYLKLSIGTHSTIDLCYKGSMYDSDGKLNEVKGEDFSLTSNYRYIDDIDGYIKDIQIKRKAIIAASDKLNALIDEYNKNVVGNLNYFEHTYKSYDF